MYARVTQFDIDPNLIDLDEALKRFEELILPDLRQRAGYRGVMAMRSDEGNGLLVTLWSSPEDAASGLASGFYDDQLAKFVAFYKEPPGREQYVVAFQEVLDPRFEMAHR